MPTETADAAVLHQLLDDLRALGRVRVVFRVHGGLGDVACESTALRVDGDFLVIGTPGCSLQIALAGIATAEFLPEEEVEAQRPCLWFFGACGIPALGLMLDRRHGTPCDARLCALAELRRRWVGRIDLGTVSAVHHRHQHHPGRTVH
jgi:hypothetical protein